KQRITKDRQHQDPDAPEAIGERPPKKRQAPTDKEQREQQPAVVPDIGFGRRQARVGKQLAERRHHDQRVDEGVHPIEGPAAPGSTEATDLVGCQSRQDRSIDEKKTEVRSPGLKCGTTSNRPALPEPFAGAPTGAAIGGCSLVKTARRRRRQKSE